MEFCSIPSGLRFSIHPCCHSRGRRIPLRHQRVLVANALHAGIEIDHIEGKFYNSIDSHNDKVQVQSVSRI